MKGDLTPLLFVGAVLLLLLIGAVVGGVVGAVKLAQGQRSWKWGSINLVSSLGWVLLAALAGPSSICGILAIMQFVVGIWLCQ
jgi:hypothetical protein